MNKLDVWSVGMVGGFLLGCLFTGYAFQAQLTDVVLERNKVCPAGYVRVQERHGPPVCVQEQEAVSWSALAAEVERKVQAKWRK